MDEVEIVEYDPRWPVLYAEELARLHVLFPPGMLLAAEHFGSTAIPGLPAKQKKARNLLNQQFTTVPKEEN